MGSEIGCRNNFVTYLCTPCIYCLCNKSNKKTNTRGCHRNIYEEVSSIVGCYIISTDEYRRIEISLFVHLRAKQSKTGVLRADMNTVACGVRANCL